MITKTKLTITIDEKLLDQFNIISDENSINKSKLIGSMIKKWIQEKNNEIKNDIR